MVPPEPPEGAPEPAPEDAGPGHAKADAGPRPGIVQWLLFLAFTGVCLLAAYLSLTGQRQVPLP